MPANFSVTVDMTSFNFTWSPPDEATQNGDIISYTFTCTSANENVIQLTLKATVFELYVDLFSPATTYTCSIAASNAVGIGPSSILSITTEGKINHMSCPR